MGIDPIEPEAREHAYLVARGVRPLAIVGNCPADPRRMFEVAAQLEEVASEGAIPFVAPRNDRIADYGFARSKWVIDLLSWAQTDAVPTEHRHRIIGLLLGYSVEAVRAHEEQGCGRLFQGTLGDLVERPGD